MSAITDLMLAVTEVRGSQEDYEKAETYYEGTQEEFFANKRLRRALEKTGNPWRLNFCRVVVRSVLDLLELTGVSSPNARVNTFLTQLWEDNDLDSQSDEVHEWTLAHGDGYITVWDAPEEMNLNTGVQVTYTSARTTRVFYDDENPMLKRFAARVWRTQDDKVRVNLMYPDRIEKYISKVKNPKTDQGFEPYFDAFEEVTDEDGNVGVEPVWPVPNPYGEVPVFHFRTKRPYGRPEHADGYAPQDMVNKLVINQLNTVDFHGFPQRYVVAEPDVDDDLDEFDDDFDDEPVEDTSGSDGQRLRQAPDAVWWLKRVKEVGQFDVADADAFLKPLDRYINAMASLTGTPLGDFEATNDAPSGESRRVARAPLVKKVSTRKQRLEPVWKEVFRFCIRVGLGTTEGDEDEGPTADPELSLNWAPVHQVDDKDSWAVVKAKQDAGVPRDRTLVEAGYEEEEVRRWDNPPSDPEGDD